MYFFFYIQIAHNTNQTHLRNPSSFYFYPIPLLQLNFPIVNGSNMAGPMCRARLLPTHSFENIEHSFWQSRATDKKDRSEKFEFCTWNHVLARVLIIETWLRKLESVVTWYRLQHFSYNPYTTYIIYPIPYHPRCRMVHPTARMVWYSHDLSVLFSVVNAALCFLSSLSIFFDFSLYRLGGK